MAWVPLCRIVEKVAGRLGEGRLENFLFPVDGEPLGPPVCGILPETLPFVLSIVFLLGYKMGVEDARGFVGQSPNLALVSLSACSFPTTP